LVQMSDVDTGPRPTLRLDRNLGIGSGKATVHEIQTVNKTGTEEYRTRNVE
jgi:hypothetical protein